MADISDILRLARSRNATDVHIVAGSPVLFRIERELQPVTKEPLTALAARQLCLSLLTPPQVAEFEASKDFDIMFADVDHKRYRVNVGYNDGDVGAVIRLLASEPMPLETLRLPEIVEKLTRARKGLILITG